MKMRTLTEWLDAYAASHQNPTNKLIHWLCVPAIMFSIIGIVWSFSPVAVFVVMAATLIFYFILSLPLSLAIIVLYVVMSCIAVSLGESLLNVSVTVFVVAWIFQFIGHKIEGKKPSFFEDIQFLLIGPLWCLSFLFKKWNLRIL
ncbi:Mpo1-like protein [Endozoicomonas sp. 4G]|uniref:Mpo1 family 2-hydroxy fatty acid dioxygenase n=1 Tax=Endozoicomonas sp. 4G TaxID=2872754 RepID=UPI002078ADE7|nr:Mpo1-like protein [Endozoicomonas sp. 4G]